jgi:hypothetical protein
MIDIEANSDKLVDTFMLEDLHKGAAEQRLTQGSYALKDSIERFKRGFVLTKYTYTHLRQTKVRLFISNDKKRLFMRKESGSGRTKSFNFSEIFGISFGNDSSTFLVNDL